MGFFWRLIIIGIIQTTVRQSPIRILKIKVVLMARHSNIEVVDMSIKSTSNRHGLTHRWLTTQTQTRRFDAGDLYFAYRGR